MVNVGQFPWGCTAHYMGLLGLCAHVCNRWLIKLGSVGTVTADGLKKKQLIAPNGCCTPRAQPMSGDPPGKAISRKGQSLGFLANRGFRMIDEDR